MGCFGSKDADLVKYYLTVKTSGGYRGGGSNSCVSINMEGESNGICTGWKRIRNIQKNDFRRGKTDEFKIKAKDVGLPLIIRLELRHRQKKDFWACDSIIVKLRDEEAVFPVYDWVEDEIWFTRGKALIHSQVSNMALRSLRTREVEDSKVRFRWITRPSKDDLTWGLPRYVDDRSMQSLPAIFLVSQIRQKNIIEKGFNAVLNEALVKLKKFGRTLDDFGCYADLYDYIHTDSHPPFMDRWQTDEEFGRQQMNGISPLSFSRCTELPNCCDITNADVCELLSNGSSLEEEMKNGRIYIGDYSKIFRGITRTKTPDGDELYCPDAICLYYVNEEDNLVPIAIQLVPGDPHTVFTPNDSGDDWLLAKMYFRVCIGNMHQWHYHFLLTHAVMEPFAVSLFRCFPRSHPLYKLLRPHLQTVSFINDQARKSLIPRDALASEALAIPAIDLVRRTFETFTMDELVVPDVLKKQGLYDATKLPKNFYREDATRLWNIIEKFVSDVITHFYKTNEDVICDENVQTFAADMVHEGLGWEDGNSKGIELPIKDVQTLVRISTTIIFTSSVQHAAVNFRQYETYKFIPNAPLAMRLPPHKKGEATMERIMKSLPDLSMSTVAITLGYILSSFSPDEVFLGQYPMKLFTDPEILVMQTNYSCSLDEFSQYVKKRNTELEYPFDSLLPEKIPNSIAI